MSVYGDLVKAKCDAFADRVEKQYLSRWFASNRTD